VRELENAIEHTVTLCRTDEIVLADLAVPRSPSLLGDDVAPGRKLEEISGGTWRRSATRPSPP
jgi:DNA-binding NtrC family response regulator